MNDKINFTAIDGKNYSFDFTLASAPENEKPLDQYENFARFNEIVKNPNRTESDLIKLHRVFFEIFIKDFLLAYPNHALAKYFDVIEGLSPEGQVKVARFLGNMKNIESLLTQFNNAILGITEKKETKKINKSKNIKIVNEDE